MNGKKKLVVGLISMAAIALSACGGPAETPENVITMIASPVPHTEILEAAKPILKEKGYELEITIVNDYQTPNRIVADGYADANYFQHSPYLELFTKENNLDLVSVGNVHLEPMAVYSKKYQSLADLPDNAVVYASTSVADIGRCIDFFVQAGLVEVRDGVTAVDARLEDIISNPKQIEIKPEIAPEFLVTTYTQEEGDAVIINANFAIDAGLSPTRDAIAVESSNSPYANLVAVRPESVDKEKIKVLMDVLQSEEIKSYIKESYPDGSILPAE